VTGEYTYCILYCESTHHEMSHIFLFVFSTTHDLSFTICSLSFN